MASAWNSSVPSGAGSAVASASAPSMLAAMAMATSSGTAGTPGRALGRGLVVTPPDTRTVLPAPPSASISSISGSAEAISASEGSGSGATGGCSLTRFFASPKPRSISSTILALRFAVEVPPNTVAMMCLLPRRAEAVRLNPAAPV